MDTERKWPYAGTEIFMDTARPYKEIHRPDSVTEIHGGFDLRDFLAGPPFYPERFGLKREVARNGDLISWRLILFPNLSDETCINLARVAEDNSNGESNRVLADFMRRIPKIEMNSENEFLKIKFSGGIGIIISDEAGLNIIGDRVEEGCKEIPISILPRSFFGDHMDTQGIMIACLLRLGSNGSILGIKEEIREIVQNGTFTEAGFRKIVDLSFDLIDIDDEIGDIDL